MTGSPALSIVTALVMLIAAGAPAAEALHLERSIPLEGVNGRIDHLAFDSQRNRLYVAALGNNTVEVIDTAAGKRAGTIKHLGAPAGVRVIASSGKTVVASGSDGEVRIFDSDLKLLGEIKDLDDADNVRLDPDEKLAFVGYGSGAIAIIDVGRAQKVGEINLTGHPESFQLESHGPRVFVNVPDAHQVAVVDRQKMTVIATWKTNGAEANFPMALDEPHHRLLIGCRRPAKVLALDTETGAKVAEVDCCADADDLFFDPSNGRVYISGGEGFVTVIEQTDPDHYRVIDRVETSPGARTSFFDSEHQTLYVAVPRRAHQEAQIRVYSPSSSRK